MMRSRGYALSLVRPILFFVIILGVFGLGSYGNAEVHQEAELKTSGAGATTRVGPGEFVPIVVKLVNFGSGRRVDVTITYQFLDSTNTPIVTQQETVAVETTASFVEYIQVPHGTPPGTYTATSSIIYEGQEVPAVSQFQFTVEKKFASFFISDLLLYGGTTLGVGLIFAVVSRIIMKRRRASRLRPHEYSDIPKGERIYYEMMSDLVMQMRYSIGEKAIELTQSIEGLDLDPDSGRVLSITKSPAKVIALLVLQFEKESGKKVNLALRGSKEATKKQVAPVDKNLFVVRKYFE